MNPHALPSGFVYLPVFVYVCKCVSSLCVCVCMCGSISVYVCLRVGVCVCLSNLRRQLRLLECVLGQQECYEEGTGGGGEGGGGKVPALSSRFNARYKVNTYEMN